MSNFHTIYWSKNFLDVLGNVKYIEIHFVCFFSFFHVSTQSPEVTAGLTFRLMSSTVQVGPHLPSKLPRADFNWPYFTDEDTKA